MLTYILLIFFLIFLRVFIFNTQELGNKKKITFIVIALLPITVVSGFRNENIGADTISYKYMFQDINNNEIPERIEKGYVLLNQFLYFFTDDSRLLFIIVAIFLSIAIGVLVHKNAKDPFLAILFFVCLGLFQFSLSGMRQTIAIAITMFSFELIKKRKMIWFLCVIFLAYQFHKSSIFFLPAFFIANRSLGGKQILFFVLGSIMVFSFGEIFLLRTADVLDYNYGIESESNGGIFFTIVLIITFFGYRFRNRILEIGNNSYQGNSNLFLINLSFISLLLWTIRLISRTAERVTFYYMPYSYLLLEETIISIKSKRERRLVYILVVVLVVFLFMYRLSRDETMVPYNFM